MNRKKDFYCSFLYKGLNISTQGAIKPCCVFKGELGQVNSETSLVGTLEGEQLKEVRELAHHGEFPSECSKCQELETIGLSSKRIRFNEFYQRTLGELDEEVSLDYLEVNLGTRCNLACVECTSEFSSLWQKIDQERYKNLPLRKHSLNFNREYNITQELFDQILKIAEGRRLRVYLLGGEPLLYSEVHYFLNQIVERKLDLFVSIVTNGTLMPEGFLKVVEALGPKLDMCLSIDHIGPVYEYMRGFSWERVEKNIINLSKVSKNILVQPCSTVYNVLVMHQYVEWLINMREKGIGQIACNFSLIASYPEYTSPNNLPLDLRLKEWERIERLLPDLNKSIEKRSIENLKVALHCPQDFNHIDDCKSWMREMNKLRGVNIWDIVPDLKIFA